MAAPVSGPPNRMSSVIVAPIDKAGDAPRPAFVDGRAVNHEYEKESQDSFHQNSLPRGQINGELWSASDDDIASEQTAGKSMQPQIPPSTLRDPIAERVRPMSCDRRKRRPKVTAGFNWPPEICSVAETKAAIVRP